MASSLAISEVKEMCDITIKKYVLYSWFSIVYSFAPANLSSFTLPSFIILYNIIKNDLSLFMQLKILARTQCANWNSMFVWTFWNRFIFGWRIRKLYFCHLAKIPLDLLLGTAHTITYEQQKPCCKSTIDNTGWHLWRILGGVTWNCICWQWELIYFFRSATI